MTINAPDPRRMVELRSLYLTRELRPSSRFHGTFENICREEPDLTFGDDSFKVVVNTKGSRGEISAELKEILTYLDNESVTGPISRELDEAVNSVKSSEERRLEYMRLTLRDNEMIAKGRDEGRKEGRDEGMILTMWDLLQKNIITLSQAAAQAGMSEQEFLKKADSYIHL